MDVRIHTIFFFAGFVSERIVRSKIFNHEGH
jgi:hypothetical protein